LISLANISGCLSNDGRLGSATACWVAAGRATTLAVLYTQTRAMWLGLILVAVALAAGGLNVAVRKYGSKSWPLFLFPD